MVNFGVVLNDQMSFECTKTIIFVLYCYVLIWSKPTKFHNHNHRMLLHIYIYIYIYIFVYFLAQKKETCG